MKTTPYTLSDLEQDQLHKLIVEAIDWAAHDNAKNIFVPQFTQERRFYIHLETREFYSFDVGPHDSGEMPGEEAREHAYLCTIPWFDVDPLDDGTSALDAVGADPAGTMLDELLEHASENLVKSEYEHC